MLWNERMYTVSWGVAMARYLWSKSRSVLVTRWYNIVLTSGVSHEVMTWGDGGEAHRHGGDWIKGGDDRDWLSTTYIRSYHILHQVYHTHHGSFLYSNCGKGVNVLTACTSRDWLDLHKELCTIRNYWGSIRGLQIIHTTYYFCITSDTARWCQSTSGQNLNQIYSYFKYSVHTKVTNITTWWPHIYTHQRLCWDCNWMRQISS